MKKIVIALGGNALLKKGDKLSMDTQAKNIEKAMQRLFYLIKANDVVIIHGNGPQAGFLLLKQDVSLDVIDAQTEGQIGYLIQQELFNLFRKHGVKRAIATVLTQVLVDSKDESFKNPSKFIGSFYSKEEADKLGKSFVIKKDSNRGWRRVVASPKPIKIIEHEVIKKMIEQKIVVIAAGGGGIPVVEVRNKLKGISAVIDKDLTSACLAKAIGADELIIITDIEGVYLNYGNVNQKKLSKVKLKELKKYYSEGHFPPGSMGPKIEAAISFISGGGKKVIITNIENIGKVGKGTVIVK